MDTAVTGSNLSRCLTKSDDFSHVVVQQLLTSPSVVESITESFSASFCLLSPTNNYYLFSILNYLPPCLQLFRCDESKSDSNAVVSAFEVVFEEEQRED